MNMTPELAAKKAAGKQYDELLRRRPELKPKALAMIDEGKTLGEIVAVLDKDGKAGWDKAVAKINARHDAMRT